MRVTEKQITKRVESWMKYLLRLGVSHWTVECVIVDAPDGNDGSAACVHSMNDYDHALLEFKRSWLAEQEDWDTIDKVIIHEILHMVFRDYDEQIHSVSSHLNTPVKVLWSQGINHELEGVIERVAQTIASLCAELVS